MSSPISGFTAIPNPQMLAFMPIQSYLMMYFAGAGWQIGKRKVSAIPNDKFNPMSATQLLEGFTADLRESIPVLEKSLQDITPLIRILIEQYGDFIKEAIAAMPQALQNIIGGGGEFQNVPTTGGSGGNLPLTMAGFLHLFKTLSDATKIDQPSSVLGSEEQTHAQRVAIQAKEDARVKRLQMELEARARAQERLDQRNVIPAAHIKDRSRSNVSMQSLNIEKTRLTASKNAAVSGLRQHKNTINGIKYRRQRGEWNSILTQRQSEVLVARQKLANFMAMHGKRF